eukprot:gene57664-biopygen28804
MAQSGQTCRIGVDFQSPADFPVALHSSERHGALLLFTLMGQCRLYDVAQGAELHKETVADAHIFASAPDAESGGAVCVSRDGAVAYLMR